MIDPRRRLLLAAVGAWALTGSARADTLDKVRSRGTLQFALYDDFAPYSDDAGGIDVELARALAARLGVKAHIVLFDAGEDLRDDLRNMVWKGGYMGNVPCDVMLHVPVDPVLIGQVPQARLFSPYHLEQIAVARDARHVPPILGLDAFTRAKIGVETGSLADDYLLSALGGRFRENLVHFRTPVEAITALREGDVQIVMGTRAPMEAALGGEITGRYPIARFTGAGIQVREWPVGLATRQDDTDLATALAGAMDALVASGEVDRLFARHFVQRMDPRDAGKTD